MKKIHAFIVSWPSMDNKAAAIAKAIRPHVKHLTIIHSKERGLMLEKENKTEWVRVPKSFYFGKKFKLMLDLNRGDFLLNIQADCETDEWEKLIARCLSAFTRHEALWLWAPMIDHTPWTNTRVELSYDPLSKESKVTQTDSLVWVLAKPLVRKMKLLQYHQNNFGWGIDWMASTYAFHTKHLVMRDQSITVKHPKGTAYDKEKAHRQQKKFLKQLTLKEKMTYHALQFYSCHLKKVLFREKG